MNIVQTKHGLMMVRHGNDLISKFLYTHGAFEWNVVDICYRLALGYSEGCILDIGANIGTVTVPLAKALPQYTIYAYEPQRPVFYQLAGNVAINDLSNVVLNQIGIGSQNKQIEIDLPRYEVNGNIGAWSMDEDVRKNNPEAKAGGAKETIQLKTLNGMQFPSPIRLIKIDVEGMELDVLRGGVNLLKSHKYPPLVYESWDKQDWFIPKAKELQSFVKSLGYNPVQTGSVVVATYPNR